MTPKNSIASYTCNWHVCIKFYTYVVILFSSYNHRWHTQMGSNNLTLWHEPSASECLPPVALQVLHTFWRSYYLSHRNYSTFPVSASRDQFDRKTGLRAICDTGNHPDYSGISTFSTLFFFKLALRTDRPGCNCAGEYIITITITRTKQITCKCRTADTRVSRPFVERIVITPVMH